MRGSRGGGGDRGSGPPEISQSIGFLSNTGPDLLRNHKATKPAFNGGPSFKWRFAGGSMMANLFGSYLPSYI